MTAGALIRTARAESGLTQAQLAARLGVSQAALAKLERPDSNPTVRTLQRVLSATGRRLELQAPAAPPAVDEGLLREALKMTPAERIVAAERLLADADAIAAAGARARNR